MKYMLMMFGSESEMRETQSPEWIRDMIEFMQQVGTDLREAGEYVGGEGLADPLQAKTVNVSNGIPVATDGPYAESKEQIGGFWVVEAADLDAAIELARRGSAACNGKVEVRPFQDDV